uniref:LEM domain-containing protein n=1 Tax=Anopheles culicifacies TaxID=139723 RepID=A0A182MTY5_9DIPT
MGDNFDDMSNDQLRLKLLEFGLANMPVTSTTRKVLIKKLRNHISTNGKRRETISLTKYSSDEDSEPAGSQKAAPKKGSSLSKKELTSRRATIGGAVVATTKPPKPVSSSQPLPKATQALPSASAAALKRRSGRVTPVKDNNAATSAPSQSAPKVPAILEDSDDDMIPLTQLTQQNRKSASPSLSRAEMLTTSYIHQMAIPPSKPSEPIEEEMEVDIPEMGKNFEKEEEDVIVLDDDEDETIAMASMPPPQQPKPPSMKVSHSQTAVQTEMPRITYHSTTTSTMTNQQDKEQKTFAEPAPLSYSSTTEGTFPKPSFYASPSVRSSMSSTVRNEPTKKIDTSESPYLSEFTKRLARLRAEAAEPSIGLGRDSPTRRTMFEGSSSSLRSTYSPRDTYEASSSRYRAGRQTIAPVGGGGGGRRTAAMQSETDIRSNVRQSLLALDRKYSIRNIFYTIIIVLVVIFLFVFFFL